MTLWIDEKIYKMQIRYINCPPKVLAQSILKYQLQAMMSESWRELSDWDKGRIEGWRSSM
jgi:hypothetical protein